MKNSADFGGCYPPRPSASVDNVLLDLQNSSYSTQPHSIVAKYQIVNIKVKSSVCGQDESNRTLWLATRAGKMELSCPLWITCHVLREKIPLKPNIKFFIDQAFSVKMVRYWPRSFLASLCTSTLSRSINTHKKNSANIQPSWPQAWSYPIYTSTPCLI